MFAAVPPSGAISAHAPARLRTTHRKDAVTSRFPDGTAGPPPGPRHDLIDSGVDLRDERSHPDVFRPGPARRRDRRWGVLAAISAGGGLGSVARYLVSLALPVTAGRFPWATFLINLSGCFALGLLMVFILDVRPPNRYVRPFAGVGFLGGYTTFSTFAVEVRGLAAHGAWTLADAYALDSLIGGLVAVWCGITLARLVAGLPVRRNRERERS